MHNEGFREREMESESDGENQCKKKGNYKRGKITTDDPKNHRGWETMNKGVH